MNSKLSKFLFLFIFSVAILAATTYAEGDKKSSNNLDKVQGTPSRTYLDINNISTIFNNDGISDIDPSGNSGLVYPKGSNKAAVFTSGLLWGALVPGDPQPRVGGTAYRTGLVPGRITNSGVPTASLTAEDKDADHVRIYRVRRDVFPGGQPVNLKSDAENETTSESALRDQYEKDWTEWPAVYGAPFEDKNGNGIYEPATDIPGVKGASQTVWYVANDLDPAKTTFLYGAQPLGVEMQATFWAYSQTGALGSMYFRKYKLINKSDTQFDSMYVSMWADVDLGNASDDYAGCDTTLSLGYVYNANANDATYNPLPPPAVGFDFFQGPVLNGIAGEDRNKNGVDDAEDFGIFNGQVVGPGKINLPMTSYYYFARGNAFLVDPTQGDIAGSTQFYRFFQGRVGLTGEFFVNPLTQQTTTYALPGDPQSRNGWIDGLVVPADDRRVGQGSGPFTMAPGDTQEVVVAEIVAGAIPGMDRLSAIGLLKFYDEQAQSAYNNFFDLPVAPPIPEINAIELDRQIVLDWGENNTRVSQTEGFNEKGYAFQGYNVYQLPSVSADKSQGKRIATFDIVDGIGKIEDREFDPSTGVVAVKVLQFGNDTGIKRFLNIENDELNGGTPLINGKRYYFAVTSYGYNPDAVPNNLENPINIMTLVPHSVDPGVVLGGTFLDTLSNVVHTGGSDGNIFPVVVDPTQLTGLTYTVSFDTLHGETVWNVRRSDGVTVLANQTNQAANEQSPIVDGIQFKVIGAPLDFKRFTVVSNANGPLNPPVMGAFAFNNSGFPTIDGLAPDGVNDRPNASQQVKGGLWGIHTADNGSRSSYSAFVSRVARNDNFSRIIPYDFEVRFTAAGGWAIDWYNTGTAVFQVPFELWNIGIGTPKDPSDDYRMIPLLLDDDASGSFNLPAPGTKSTGTDDHTISGGGNDPYTDWIYWSNPANKTPGQAGYNEAVSFMQAGTFDNSAATGAGAEVMARMVFVELNGGTAPPYVSDMLETGTTFRIESTKPNQAGTDVFTFTAPKSVYTQEQAKADVNKINVFPNPYYGVNSEELNKYNRFVTFSHLPAKASIKIFNLAGVLVKTIEKTDASQFTRWDLANQSGLPVASGLYIAYIDMPDVGTTKILKIAVIQEQQILDRF